MGKESFALLSRDPRVKGPTGKEMTAESRNDLKRFPAIESVNGKSSSVQSKHLLGLQLFPQNNQSGVGKIHRDVTVPFHKDCGSLDTFR